MATYQELKAQAEALADQAEAARLAEIDDAIATVQKLVRDYELTPKQVFGTDFVPDVNEGEDEIRANELQEKVEDVHKNAATALRKKTTLNPAAAWPFPTDSIP